MDIEETPDIYVGCQIMGALFDYCRSEHIAPDDYLSIFGIHHGYFHQGYLGTLEEDSLESEYEDPEYNKDEIYRIRQDGNYIVITLCYISMMVSNRLVEEFLCARWYQTRCAFIAVASESGGGDIAFLGEKGFGIKLEAFAGIGGYSESGSYPQAILLTPEDMKRLISSFQWKSK